MGIIIYNTVIFTFSIFIFKISSPYSTNDCIVFKCHISYKSISASIFWLGFTLHHHSNGYIVYGDFIGEGRPQVPALA